MAMLGETSSFMKDVDKTTTYTAANNAGYIVDLVKASAKEVDGSL